MHIVGHWFDTACIPNPIHVSEYKDLEVDVLLRRFNDATVAVSGRHDVYAWKHLQQAGIDFCQLEWLHISRYDMIGIVRNLLI